MIDFRNAVTALALVLAVAGAASPALAKERTSHPGHAARAQAVPSPAGPSEAGSDGMSSHRSQAIRECMGTSSKFLETTWGNMSSHQYRTCMATHGEQE
jgi:hypothetical protein